MANVLPMAKRIEVIAHLCEGAGIRPTSRLTGVSKGTITALLLKIGAGCDRLHDRLVQNLDIREVELDELWTFVQKKAARVKPEDPSEWGDQYTYLALARTQKVIVSYRVGKRDQANTEAFMADMRARLVTVPQISSDGWQPYPGAVGQNFETADLGIVQKDYSRSPRRVRDGNPHDHKFEPPRNPFVTRRVAMGVPDPDRISTSHVERLNLDVRMQTRRFTRLCNGFSRSLPHLMAAVSLFAAYVNFCRIHGALRVTPGMEAGIVPTAWSVAELVARALEAAGEPVAKPVKKPLRLPAPPAGVPAPTARELPTGGFLRVVTGGGAPQAPSTPPTPAAPATHGPALPVEPAGQLDLFAWRPPRRVPVQLDLFGAEV